VQEERNLQITLTLKGERGRKGGGFEGRFRAIQLEEIKTKHMWMARIRKKDGYPILTKAV